MAVTLAASLAQRLLEMGLPVGLAINGEPGGLLRPDNGPDHLNRIMENLAEAQTGTETSLPTFLYGMRPHLNHFHSVTVISANTDADWIVALLDLKRLNVKASLALVDPSHRGATGRCGQWWRGRRPSCFRSTVAFREDGSQRAVPAR